MNNKTGKVIWFTFKQVVTSNWFCLISVLGLVCVFFSPIVSVVTNDLIQLTWAEVAENAGIQMLEVVIVALICARFYRRGVVSYGIRKLSFNKLFKKG